MYRKDLHIERELPEKNTKKTYESAKETDKRYLQKRLTKRTLEMQISGKRRTEGAYKRESPKTNAKTTHTSDF